MYLYVQSESHWMETTRVMAFAFLRDAIINEWLEKPLKQ